MLAGNGIVRSDVILTAIFIIAVTIRKNFIIETCNRVVDAGQGFVCNKVVLASIDVITITVSPSVLAGELDGIHRGLTAAFDYIGCPEIEFTPVADVSVTIRIAIDTCDRLVIGGIAGYDIETAVFGDTFPITHI